VALGDGVCCGPTLAQNWLVLSAEHMLRTGRRFSMQAADKGKTVDKQSADHGKTRYGSNTNAVVSVVSTLPIEYCVGQKQDRMWGRYEVIAVTPLTCTKRIVIKPLSANSLQRHEKRSERWSVEGDGVLTAVVGDQMLFGRSTDKSPIEVPVGVLHAMINCGDAEINVIEVQTGRCSEDDIIRLRDPYGNPCVPIPEHVPTLQSVHLYDAILTFLKK
jgi:mannose-6-phosphate isomerase